MKTKWTEEEYDRLINEVFDNYVEPDQVNQRIDRLQKEQYSFIDEECKAEWEQLIGEQLTLGMVYQLMKEGSILV